MKNQIIEKIFRVVIYLRLSDEDGDNQESDSISNQRILNCELPVIFPPKEKRTK